MKNALLKTALFILICIFLLFFSAFISFMVVTSRGDAHPQTVLGSKDIIHTTIKEIKKEPNENQKKEERINILVAAIDGKDHQLTIVASLSKNNGGLDLIFIPKDTYYQVTGGNRSNIDKIGEIYSVLKIQGLLQAVEALLPSLTLDHYVMIDAGGFETIIDFLGGVDVTIEQPIHYDQSLELSPGSYTLNGEKSLKYIRYINGTKENQLQQEFILSAIEKAMAGKLPIIMNTAYRNSESDLNMMQLTEITSLSQHLTSDNIRAHTLPGSMTAEEYYVVDTEAVKKLLEAVNPVETAN